MQYPGQVLFVEGNPPAEATRRSSTFPVGIANVAGNVDVSSHYPAQVGSSNYATQQFHPSTRVARDNFGDFPTRQSPTGTPHPPPPLEREQRDYQRAGIEVLPHNRTYTSKPTQPPQSPVPHGPAPVGAHAQHYLLFDGSGTPVQQQSCSQVQQQERYAPPTSHSLRYNDDSHYSQAPTLPFPGESRGEFLPTGSYIMSPTNFHAIHYHFPPMGRYCIVTPLNMFLAILRSLRR